MKAYVLNGPREIRAEERPLPACGPNDVLVRVRRVGLCGSDLHLYAGTYNGPHNYPMLFGHEWSGIVEAVGRGVTDLASGDKVTGDCSKYCGQCDWCAADQNLCRHIEKYGITCDGASSQYIVRPRQYLYRAAPDTDLTLLALTEPIAVAHHLLARVCAVCGPLAGKRILVYGGGAIGLAALLLLLHQHNCTDVALTDLIPRRVELARQLGARVPSDEELRWQGGEDYHSMYNDTPYDIIIETTGAAPVFSHSLELLRPLGVLGCVGMIAAADIAQKLIVTKDLTVLGSVGGTGDFPQVIDFVAHWPEDARRLVSHCFDIAQVDEAFAVAADAQRAIKIMLEL